MGSNNNEYESNEDFLRRRNSLKQDSKYNFKELMGIALCIIIIEKGGYYVSW